MFETCSTCRYERRFLLPGELELGNIDLPVLAAVDDAQVKGEGFASVIDSHNHSTSLQWPGCKDREMIIDLDFSGEGD